MPPGHLIFETLQKLLHQRRRLQKVAKITPVIKDIIQPVTKESQHVDHVVIEICMGHTTNEDSSDIYALGDQRRDERLPHRPTSH